MAGTLIATRSLRQPMPNDLTPPATALSPPLQAADLAGCEHEPIRVPGGIQPHGRMLVLDARMGALVAWSENWPDAATARAVAARVLDQQRPALDRLPAGEAPELLGPYTDPDGTFVDLTAHRSADRVVLEFERNDAPAGRSAPILSLARHFLPRMKAGQTVQQLAELAAVEMKRLTGFGRCLVYRFDEHGHGEVLAECADPGYDSYAEHRFPATDIPRQARELYLLNQFRLIADANYVLVPLRCVDDTVRPTDIDLTFAGLRSVSPVHLEYMRNMGTRASLSVSIVVRGRLWGLISCHDHAPRFLPYDTRLACEHLGRLLALQVETSEDHADVAARLERRQLTLSIVSHLTESDGTLSQLAREPVPLLQLARATGAAIVLNDDVWPVGDCPSPDKVREIASWIAHQKRELVTTDCLEQALPDIADPSVATGVMAIAISQVHRHQVIWFRPEFVQTIHWAGDPRKDVQAGDGRLHPRRSFASWKEQRRGHSQPWTAVETSAAMELRQALIGIVLRSAEELAGVANELGRVNKELEAFSYTVSHDLRAPMRHIAGYVDLVVEAEDGRIGERSVRYLQHVKEAAAFAGQLVDALLDFSRLGRAALKRSVIDTDAMVAGLVKEMSLGVGSHPVEWQVPPGLPTLWGDPFLVQVAVRNLFSNAVKYTRDRDPARIRVVPVDRPEGVGLEIHDNGVGFQMKYVDKLFGVFQRLHKAEEFEGTGIGLANVRRIVERHGGTVWARGEPGQGAVFGFLLPVRRRED